MKAILNNTQTHTCSARMCVEVGCVQDGCWTSALSLSHIPSPESRIFDVGNSILKRSLNFQWVYEAKLKTNTESTRVDLWFF